MATDTTPKAPVQTADVTSPIVQGGEPQAPAPDPTVGGDLAPAPAPAPVDVAPAPTPSLSPTQNTTDPDWYVKRINEVTLKRHEAERTARAEAEAKVKAEAKVAELLAQMAKGGAPSPAPAAGLTEEEVERRATEKAQQMAAANRFNEACNNIVADGKKEFADWDNAVKNLTAVGAVGQNVSPEFLETAIELKNPAKILHHLGQNLEEAERIIKLPPKKMALEMARLEASLNAPPPPAPAPAPAPAPISNAPAPVIPVNGGSATPGVKTLDDPSLTTEEFMALRSKQREERQKRYQRV